MIVRIVNMTFRPQETQNFLDLFHAHDDKIRAQKGCHHLELLQDIHNPARYSTYSIWDSTQDLDAYRNSDLFALVWSETKALFADKPTAQSFTKQTILL